MAGLLGYSVRVLVTGATGLLGRSLIANAPRETDLFATSRHASSAQFEAPAVPLDLDLLETSALLGALDSIRPDVIIHAAAEGSVDAVQGHADRFAKLNVSVASQIADWCRVNSRYLVHISSNAVFGGRSTPYADYDATNPINDYGQLKVDAEVAVSSVLPSALIFRPILMYGWPGPQARTNPVASWVSQLRMDKSLKIVEDVVSQPLACWDAAKAIWRAVGVRSSGPINASGGESLTLYEFALLTAETFELDTSLISGIQSYELDGLAPRPHCTMFDNKRLTEELAITPLSPRQGLQVMRLTEDSLTEENA